MTDEKVKMANQFIKGCGIKITCKFDREDKFFSNDDANRRIFLVKMERDEDVFEYEFGLDVERSKNNEKPSSYDILESFNPYLFPINPTLKGFAAEYGLPYETKEDQKAVKTEYALARIEWENVLNLFGKDYCELRKLIA